MNQTELENSTCGNDAFAFNLYQHLRKEEGNLFFSPFSLTTALAMTWAGARGETESQMASVLSFEQGQEQTHASFADLLAKLAEAEAAGIQLKTANFIWPQTGHPFLDSFLEVVRNRYRVAVQALDYQSDPEKARGIINQWVEQKTESKIKELIPGGLLDTLTRLVLTNAIYFKGDWAGQFDAKATRQAGFFAPHGQLRVPMMTRQGEYRYSETRETQILELPYTGGTLSMLIFLPRAKDGLPNLENQLSQDFFSKQTQNLFEGALTVQLPKFKMESFFRLKETLIAMGMPDAFDAEKADFSGMDGRKWLTIAHVLHKAFVEVNETGSEAAAASAVIIKGRAAAVPSPVFRADHPFLFFIRENQTGSILFMGRLLKP